MRGHAGVDVGEALRVVAGVAMLAVLPGWIWSGVLVQRARGLERAVVSVVLSIGMMTLVLYLGSAVFGIAVHAAHALWWSLALSLAGVGARLLSVRPQRT